MLLVRVWSIGAGDGWLGGRSRLVDARLLGAGVTLVGTLTGLEISATDIDGGRYLRSGLSG